MDPITGAGLAKTAWDLASKARQLAKDIGNKELNESILDLQHALMELSQQNMALTQRVNELETTAKRKAAMKFDGKVFWTGPDKKHPEDGPYCQPCLEGRDNETRLQRLDDGWICRVCNGTFDVRPVAYISGGDYNPFRDIDV